MSCAILAATLFNSLTGGKKEKDSVTGGEKEENSVTGGKNSLTVRKIA